MARMRDALRLAVVAALLMLAGCSVAQSRELDEDPIEVEEAAASQTDAVSTVGAGSQTTDDGRWSETWEEAALAEAERLHPGLTSPTAERVNLTTVGERVVVRGVNGFCAIYGGTVVEDRWQANEVMVLDDHCGGE